MCSDESMLRCAGWETGTNEQKSGAAESHGGRVVGIILAGMHTWGESALERICPRPLLPVAGRPLVSHVLDWLRSSGISHTTICANSQSETFRRCLGDGSAHGMTLSYYQDPMPRGPAGCVRDAALQTAAEEFLVVDGTIVTRVDALDLLRAHRQSGASLTVAVEARGHGTDARGVPLEPAGMYIVSRRAIEHVVESGYQDIKEVWIPRLYEQRRGAATHLVPSDASRRITGPSSYLEANSWVLEDIGNPCTTGGQYRKVGQALVHCSSQIHSTACLAGPVLIGPRCVIEGAATIVGPTVIGPDCRVEREAMVGRSVIWHESQIRSRAVVDHCILVDGSIVGPDSAVRDVVQTVRRARRRAQIDQSALYWALPVSHASAKVSVRHLAEADSSPSRVPLLLPGRRLGARVAPLASR